MAKAKFDVGGREVEEVSNLFAGVEEVSAPSVEVSVPATAEPTVAASTSPLVSTESPQVGVSAAYMNSPGVRLPADYSQNLAADGTEIYPIFSNLLASQGKCYSVEALYGRGFTVGEVLVISKWETATVSMVAGVFEKIVKPLSVYDLLLCDLRQLAMFSSYYTHTSFPINFDYTCNACQTESSLKYLPGDWDFETLSASEFVLSKDLSFKPVRVKDQIYMDLIESKKDDLVSYAKGFGMVDSGALGALGIHFDSSLVQLAIQSDYSIADNKDFVRLCERYTMLFDLPARYTTDLAEFVSLVSPGLTPAEVVCPNCESRFRLNLKLSVSQLLV